MNKTYSVDVIDIDQESQSSMKFNTNEQTSAMENNELLTTARNNFVIKHFKHLFH